jgi:hypothetical protein
MEGLMSEADDRGSTNESTEQTEMLGRRDAVKRFAKYTAPVMLAVLISASGSTKATAVSGCGEDCETR